MSVLDLVDGAAIRRVILVGQGAYPTMSIHGASKWGVEGFVTIGLLTSGLVR